MNELKRKGLAFQSERGIMERLGVHPGLEARLQLLAEQISEIRRGATADDLEKIDSRIKVDELERRLEAWEKRLQALNRGGSGFFSRLKAGMAQVAFDVTASFQSFGERLDSGFRAANRPDERYGSQ
jgi:hypothetical protein